MSQSIDALAAALRALDGKGYKAYRSIKGTWSANGYELHIDHVQGDPFAEPSRFRARVGTTAAGLPDWSLSTPIRRLASADFLNRRFADALRDASSHRGSGKSGELRILTPGQQVLERASLRVEANGVVEARFRVGLPARGRRILGHQAARLVREDVDSALQRGLRMVAGASLPELLRRHVDVVEDARALRDQLADRGLVGFVADGAILPRRSGVDDRPHGAGRVVPFRSPDSLRVTLQAPNAGPVEGMGVPRGVTLIVGGGFHGKSTLLRAIERGVYDHVPDDGRERVVTVPGAVKVRAEDGRAVAGVDISNFIGDLPGGLSTQSFTTENASGSTSQAAAIVEALEVGADCLLLDEDTSATNFMIRDARMQALIATEHEPITPYIDRARQLAEEAGVSTVLVVGGSGDYFDVADTVIAMREYVPDDVTDAARRAAAHQPTSRAREGGPWRLLAARVPQPASLDPSKGRRSSHVRAVSDERLLFGREEVDLGAVEQIVERAQVRAIALALAWARGRAIDGQRPMQDAMEQIMAALQAAGLDAFQREATGELAAFRVFELAAVLGRVRGFRTRGRGDAEG